MVSPFSRCPQHHLFLSHIFSALLKDEYERECTAFACASHCCSLTQSLLLALSLALARALSFALSVPHPLTLARNPSPSPSPATPHPRRSRLADATQLAQGYRDLPYFSHALELLMHETLDRHMPGRRGPGAGPARASAGARAHAGAAAEAVPDVDRAVLANVIQFAEQFPNYVEVVVQCARKTEVDSWPDLFHFAGDPVELFEVCCTHPHPLKSWLRGGGALMFVCGQGGPCPPCRPASSPAGSRRPRST